VTDNAQLWLQKLKGEAGEIVSATPRHQKSPDNVLKYLGSYTHCIAISCG